MFLPCGGAGPGDAIAPHTALVWVYSVNQEMLRVNTSVRRVPAGGWQEGSAVQGEHVGGQGWSPPAAPRLVPGAGKQPGLAGLRGEGDDAELS